MNVSQENTDVLNATVTIEIEPTDYTGQVKSILDEHRKKMTLQGFRPGKVPFSVAKKMYGKAVLAEELNKILSEKLNAHIQENEIEILGEPMPEDINELDLDFDKSYEFKYSLGIAPKFETELTEKDKFVKYDIKVDDELINKYVRDFQRRFGDSTEVEIVGENDLIYGSIYELDKDGNRKEGGVHNHTTIAVDYVETKAAREKLIGLDKGAVTVVEPSKLAKGEADLSAMLGIPVSKLDEVSKKFELTIESINNIKMHEINKELFQKVLGGATVETEEEFRNKISEDLSKHLESDSDKKLRRDVQDKLLDKLKLELPDEFLKNWLLRTGSQNPEKPVTQDDIDREYDDYSRVLRVQLIEAQLAKSNDIKVEFAEIEERVKDNLRAQFAQFGQGEVEDGMLNQFAQNFLQKEEEVRKVYDQLMEERLMAFYLSKVKVQNKEVSFDEFVKLASSKSDKGNFMNQVSNLLKF